MKSKLIILNVATLEIKGSTINIIDTIPYNVLFSTSNSVQFHLITKYGLTHIMGFFYPYNHPIGLELIFLMEKSNILHLILEMVCGLILVFPQH